MGKKWYSKFSIEFHQSVTNCNTKVLRVKIITKTINKYKICGIWILDEICVLKEN
jgi:hypothetical protein